VLAAASARTGRSGILCALLLAAALFPVLGSSPAEAEGTLGSPPVSCNVSHEEPCMEQTYYGELTVSNHEVRAGEVLIFEETPKEGGTFEGWGYQEPVSFPGYVSGCTKTSTTCSYRAE
jgi:hypothetical protein